MDEAEIKRPSKEEYLKQIRASKEQTESTDTPVKAEETVAETPQVEAQEQTSTEEEASQEIDYKSEYEKTIARLEEQRSYHDRHYNQIKEKLDKRERVLSRFDNYIKRDENGDPVDWNFGNVEQKSEPNPEELAKNPKELVNYFTRQVEDTLEKKIDAKFRAQQEAEEKKAKAEQWQKTVNDSYELAVKEYPILSDQKSEMFQKTLELMKNDVYLQQNPRGDYIAATLVAQELGLTPTSKQKIKQQTEKRADRPSIIQGKSGGVSMGSDSGKITFDSLKSMDNTERIAAMKRNYLSSIRGG